MENEYLAKFDAVGHRETTVVSGVHYETEGERQKYLDDGFIPITDEDYQYYIGNRGMGDNGTGYIRDPKTGKPVSAPPAPPAPAVPDVLAEPVVDDVRLAAFEAMAEQEARLITYSERLAAVEAALKGGEGK